MNPEQILLQMRDMNAELYRAVWTDDADELIGAVLIVDGPEKAKQLMDFAATLESA